MTMAEKGEDISTEGEIQALLEEEAVRRDEFKKKLQELLYRKDRELREQKTGGHNATVPNLVKRLEYVDAAVVPLLLQCQNFSLDDVTRTGTTGRDSGLGRSDDVDNKKRQAVYFPREDGLPHESAGVGRQRAEAQESGAGLGFPECADAEGSLPNVLRDICYREPQEHADQSSWGSD